MDQPFFSIIIPSYNSAAYIEATLASLGAQQFNSFEAIVIDDGSSDDSVAVARTAMKKHQLQGQVIVRPGNVEKGVANCRNLGMKHAAAPWVCFLDSDDLFLPGKLSKTAGFIDKYGSSCFAYFHGARQFEDGTNKTLSIPAIESYTVPKNIFPELIHKNIITTSSVTLNKKLAESIGGFDSTLHGIEDYMLWLRISKRSPWHYTSDLLTDYRVRASSLMGGREMVYYVEQNKNLISSVKALIEFTMSDVEAIEHYLFDDVMHYYAQVALNGRGWADFLKGLKALRHIGKSKLANQLLGKHIKFAALQGISRIKPKSRTK